MIICKKVKATYEVQAAFYEELKLLDGQKKADEFLILLTDLFYLPLSSEERMDDKLLLQYPVLASISMSQNKAEGLNNENQGIFELYEKELEARGQALYLNTRCNNESTEAVSSLTAFTEKAGDLRMTAEEKVSGLIQNSFLILSLVIVLGTVISFFIANFIGRKGIAVPLSLFQTLFNQGADGDLNVRSKNTGNDEIGDLSRKFNEFMTQLSLVIGKIKTTTVSVGAFNETLLSSSEQTDANLSQIKKNIHSITVDSESLDEMAISNVSTIEQLSSNLESINDQIEQQVSMVEESGASVTQMLSSIKSVHDITLKKSTAIEQLTNLGEDSSRSLNEMSVGFRKNVLDKIESISIMANTIQNISAQTNLLSMNAAIEAAHAGDSGKGFAVVADEIRKLADSSSKSSVNIDKLIKEIIHGVSETEQKTLKSTRNLDAILHEIHSTKEAFDEILSSAKELLTGSNEILESVTMLGQITSTISDASHEISDGTTPLVQAQQQLKDISGTLQQKISEIGQGSDEIVQASRELLNLSSSLGTEVQDLKEETDRFKI